GKHNQVKRFLCHYETLCTKYHINTDQEKCENVTLYCSSCITQLIEILPHYRNNDWARLKADFLNFFDADKDAKRYKVCSLVSFVNKHHTGSIWTLSEWKYTWEFVAIGGWLLAKNKISSNDHATYFWKGIPKALQTKIETQLMAPSPLRDMTTPFPFEEVSQAAEKILQCDHFDTDDSDSEDPDSSTDSDEDLSSEEE
ncbi:hypothetical protein BDR04DRAFT_982812, partial [Suillus decipiens]